MSTSRGLVPALTICRMMRSEEHTSELQSRVDLVCRLLLVKISEQLGGLFNRAVYLLVLPDRDLLAVLPLLVDRDHLAFVFFFNDTPTTEIYPLSLHDALPICIEILAPEETANHSSGTPIRSARSIAAM